MKNQPQSTFDRIKPFLAVIFLQFGFAGMDVLCKAALNKGMSNYVLVVYRHLVATIVIAPFAVILDKFSLSLSLSKAHPQTQATLNRRLKVFCFFVFFFFFCVQESKAKDDTSNLHQNNRAQLIGVNFLYY
jgi:hypothetical protein